jgi:hypothetical protein
MLGWTEFVDGHPNRNFRQHNHVMFIPRMGPSEYILPLISE